MNNPPFGVSPSPHPWNFKRFFWITWNSLSIDIIFPQSRGDGGYTQTTHNVPPFAVLWPYRTHLGSGICWKKATYELISTYPGCLQLINLSDISVTVGHKRDMGSPTCGTSSVPLLTYRTSECTCWSQGSTMFIRKHRPSGTFPLSVAIFASFSLFFSFGGGLHRFGKKLGTPTYVLMHMTGGFQRINLVSIVRCSRSRSTQCMWGA